MTCVARSKQTSDHSSRIPALRSPANKVASNIARPNLHPDADRAHLQQHGAGRPTRAAAGADAAFHRRGR
jgi:hypothetical protein